MPTSFVEEYNRLAPIQVTTPAGALLIPVGVVIFKDGIGYADDGVLQDFPSHFPIHQLIGDVSRDGRRLICDQHIFEPIPADSATYISDAWCWIRDMVNHPVEFRLNIENKIRADRDRGYQSSVARNVTAKYGDDDLRDCFREPISEIFDAATLLNEAVNAHNVGRTAAAETLIRAADMPVIGDWLDSIWLANSKYRHSRPIADLPPILSKSLRYRPRMPSTTMKWQLIARDGYHCLFCGIPLVRAEVRKLLASLYPSAARWTGPKEDQQHRGLQAMWLQYDHVVVHSRGGETTLENMVIACPACNFGRDRFMLDEVGIRDPRDHPRSYYWHGRATWDGLDRVNTLIRPVL